MAKTDRSDMRIVIIGAGMAGLLAAIRLKAEGYANFVIYEKADRIGGTWRDNRYPGLTCDIPSHAYTYSFAPNPEWSQRYPPGAEIFDYFANIVQTYGLAGDIQCNHEVVSSLYENGAWTLTTAAGATETAEVVIVATGVLHHPKYPDIEGLGRFEGAMFHSARWDGSVPLDGRRVGVIGSGSTGVQIVSALAGRVARLTHFQRTPQWVIRTENPSFTEAERAAFRSDAELIRQLHHTPEFQEGLRFFSRAVTDANSPEMAAFEAVALQHLETSIRDPVLKEKLRPSYRAACKRMIMSPDYFEKVQDPSVEVVTDRIAAVEAQGVRTEDGVLRELDVLVLATGFHADQFMRPMNVVGRGGAELNARWARRPSAYLALSIPDFPNLFLLNGPSAPFGNFSAIDVAERQMAYILKLLQPLREGRCREVSVSPEAMATYDQEVIAATKGTIWSSGCKSWYLDADGVPTIWPWTYDAFVERTAEPRFEAFDLVA